MQRGHTSRQAAGEVHMPLQSLALKVLSTRYADGHPLETCGLHQKKKKKEKERKVARAADQRGGGEARGRAEGRPSLSATADPAPKRALPTARKKARTTRSKDGAVSDELNPSAGAKLASKAMMAMKSSV